MSAGWQWSAAAQRLSGQAEGRVTQEQRTACEETTRQWTSRTSANQHEESCLFKLLEQNQRRPIPDPGEWRQQAEGESGSELQYHGSVQWWELSTMCDNAVSATITTSPKEPLQNSLSRTSLSRIIGDTHVHTHAGTHTGYIQ